MANELQIWTIGDSNGDVVRVESRNQTDTEKLLEDVLVKQPSMLMPGLTLVGRQTSVVSGNLDLLGVDSEGRLIVFELKRGALTRDAVTQVIDYASDLEAREISDLYSHITERSGTHGIDRIDDFGEWYEDNFPEQDLKPVRMALVGLGVDDNATRIVKYLADRGVEIDLLTFHAFEHEGKTLLARQVELISLTHQEAAKGPRIRNSAADYRRVEEHVRGLGITFWDDALAEFRKVGAASEYVRTNGFAFGRPKLVLPEHESSFTVYQSLRALDPEKIRITFLPIAVHLCQAEFEAADRSIQFERELAPNAPHTNKIKHQWYCVLDEAGWNEHKNTLLTLSSSVYQTWDKAYRGNFINLETPLAKQGHGPVQADKAATSAVNGL